MEIAMYVRVSTHRQQQAQTIDQQLARLQEYTATQPTWHLHEQHIYRDDGYSGATLNRPGLDRLRDHALLAAFTRRVPGRSPDSPRPTCPQVRPSDPPGRGTTSTWL